MPWTWATRARCPTTWPNFKLMEPMRPRPNNEKILLMLLAAIIFLGGNFYGYRWLAQKQSSLHLAYLQLQGDQAEAKHDLQESGLWAQRKAWVNNHEPALGDEGDAKA